MISSCYKMPLTQQNTSMKLFLSQGQPDEKEKEEKKVCLTPAPRFSSFSSTRDNFRWKPRVLTKIEDGKKGLHMKRTYTTKEVDVNLVEMDKQVHAPSPRLGNRVPLRL